MAIPKSIATTGLVISGSGVLDSINLKAAADVATLIIYDGTDTDGTKIWELAAIANTSCGNSKLDISFSTGIYATLTGTNSTGLVTIR